MYKYRILNIAKFIFIIVIIGLSYAFIYMLTGVGIPCIFNLVTGLKCPGCGITHMCVAILNLDFISAYNYNPIIFCLLPFWVFALLYQLIKYIKTGSTKFSKPVNALIYLSIIILLIWGIYRNI